MLPDRPKLFATLFEQTEKYISSDFEDALNDGSYRFYCYLKGSSGIKGLIHAEKEKLKTVVELTFDNGRAGMQYTGRCLLLLENPKTYELLQKHLKQHAVEFGECRSIFFLRRNLNYFIWDEDEDREWYKIDLN